MRQLEEADLIERLVAGGKQDEEFGMAARKHSRHPPCWATGHSGQPPNQPLFNGTVCRGASSYFSARQGDDTNRPKGVDEEGM